MYIKVTFLFLYDNYFACVYKESSHKFMDWEINWLWYYVIDIPENFSSQMKIFNSNNYSSQWKIPKYVSMPSLQTTRNIPLLKQVGFIKYIAIRETTQMRNLSVSQRVLERIYYVICTSFG